MVRIKHRYLLINVLYPDQEISPKPHHNKKPTAVSSSFAQNKTDDPEDLPWTVQFRRPSADAFNAKLLAKLIRQGVEDLFGEYGAGMIAASFQVKYISPTTSTAIIRVSRAHYRLIWAALAFITKLPAASGASQNQNYGGKNPAGNNDRARESERPCVIQVVRVSGTIKKAEEEAIRQARGSIVRARREEERVRGSGGDGGGVRGLSGEGGGRGDGGERRFGRGIESDDDDGDGEDGEDSEDDGSVS